MRALTLTLLPGALALLEAQQEELPQKDALCGAFWALVTLRAFGGDAAAYQDAVAARSGTVLPPPDVDGPRPPGEPARTDYRQPLRLRRAPHPGRAGVSAGGVARAVEELSGGHLAVVPVAGPGDPVRLGRLLTRLADHPAGVVCLANLSTGPLWGPHPTVSDLLRYLADGQHGHGPPAAWDVGHFVALVGLAAGPVGTLVAVADSYRSLGSDGLHLQPIERVAAGLHRDGTGGGGLLVVARTEDGPELARTAIELGFDVRLWDNGSPEPPESAPGTEHDRDISPEIVTRA